MSQAYMGPIILDTEMVDLLFGIQYDCVGIYSIDHRMWPNGAMVDCNFTFVTFFFEQALVTVGLYCTKI